MADTPASGVTYDREAEDFPLSEVPAGARKGFGSLAVVLLGFTFFTATMFAGGEMGPAFPFWPDLVGLIVAGNLLLGAYVAVLGFIAARSGLNTVLMSRFCFGRVGGRLTDVVLGVTQIGWYGWGTATIAVVLLRLTGVAEGSTAYAPLLYGLMVVFGAAFCWTAWIGYRGLELLSIVAVPLMTALLAWSLALALRDAGGLAGLAAREPVAGMGIGAALTVVFGTFASGGTQATNWTRFARSGRAAVLASLAAFFVGNGLMVTTGAIGALVYRQPDVVDVLVIQGLLSVGVVMLFLNIWTTQDNTIYNFSVAGCAFFRSTKRRLFTILGAAVGTLLAFLRIDLYLVDFLLLLGTFVPPIGGVIMADFFVRHRGRYPRLADVAFPAFHWPGLAAYALGCLVAYVTPGVPPLNGIVTAFVVHALASRLATGGAARASSPS